MVVGDRKIEVQHHVTKSIVSIYPTTLRPLHSTIYTQENAEN